MKFKTFTSFMAILSFSACIHKPIVEKTVLEPKIVAKFPNTKNELKRPNAIKWRDYYQNRDLIAAIETALTQNQDLKIAALNIEKSQNLLKISRQNQKPKIIGQAGFDIAGNKDNLISDDFNIGLLMPSYEIDVFGRLKNLEKIRENEFFALKSNQNAIKIALIAQIANVWVNIAGDNDDIIIIKANLSSLNETLKIIEGRQKYGVANDLDVNSVRAQKYELVASLKAAQTNLEGNKAQLILLANSEKILEYLPKKGVASYDFAQVPVGLPAEVLISRPDIMAIEFDLLAANANIDNARLAKFPTINLTSVLGLASGELLGLFKNAQYNFSPSVALPIFDNGINEINIENSKIDRNIIIAQYEKAIAQAFYEVSDALAILSQIDGRIKNQEQAIMALEKSVFIAKKRFTVGIDNYLPYLLAQRQLNNAQLNLSNLRQIRASAMINLYSALGNDADF